MIVGVVGGGLYLFGTHLGARLQDVLRRVGAAERSIGQALHASGLGKLVLSHFQAHELSLAKIVGKVFTISAAFLASLVVLVVAGVNLAAQPLLYREGLNQMFPPRMRPQASDTIDDIAWALRRWLLGQLIQMLIIGACSGLAALLIGLPTPWALGLIAGIAEFVPYPRPVVASIPAIFVATTVDLSAVLWTLFTYIIIHHTEGHLVTDGVYSARGYGARDPGDRSLFRRRRDDLCRSNDGCAFRGGEKKRRECRSPDTNFPYTETEADIACSVK